MAESARPSPGGIFISYRREETAYPAGWLYDRLVDHFGGGQVFKDVDSIELGDDFVEVITTAVGSCDVLLALIGDRWLTILDEDGRRRLDDPADFVRVEIEAALTRNVRVVPILVDGARMPRAAELPPSLAKLVRRQALELSPARFDFDTSRLLRVLDRTLDEVRTAAREDAAAISAPADRPPDLTAAEPPTAPESQKPAESSPTHSIPPAGVAASAAPASLDLNEPPDRGTTEVKEAPERRKPAESSPMPSVPPAARARFLDVLHDRLRASKPRARTGQAGPPPGEGEPRWRLSRRAWMLAGAAAIALILLVVVVVANTSSVIFEDDFSSTASGWSVDVSDAGDGDYANGAYRIHADAGGYAGAAPASASSVYPSAPPRIEITVDAHRIAGSFQDAEYGIVCRAMSSDSRQAWYAFVVKGNSGTIYRHDTSIDTPDDPLVTGTAQVDANGTNHLFATCERTEDGVYVQLWVNDEEVAEHTDREGPLPDGTVGFFAGSENTETATEVEFDNFEVRHVGHWWALAALTPAS
jgi:hypothetical protein